MKILQINTVCDFGSTGRTTRELADYLEQQGHECFVAYGHGLATFHNSMKIGNYYENLFHNVFFTRLLGLHGYGSYFGTKKLIRWIEENKPDIVHLRNLHINYLNLPMLYDFLVKKNIPVVLTLHDCYNFTGKCSHYTANKCYKWQTECNYCPYKNTTAPAYLFDHSQRVFRLKKSFYNRIQNLTVVAVSKWLRDEAAKSMMACKGHKITYVYNWIDYSKFHRVTTEEVTDFIQQYNLDSQYKYLISVSQGWDKNASRFKDAKHLAEKLPQGYKLILVGSKTQATEISAPLIHIPYINGTKELSKAYTLAEAYVHLSVEDTFGKVIAEAMACGTVPIAFNSTACGEVAGPYSIVVEPHDIDAIIKRLPELEYLKAHGQDIIQYVHDNYDYHTNAQQYIDLYKKILEIKQTIE